MAGILLDEGISWLAAQMLRDAGFDAVHIQEIGLLSAPDTAILLAGREQDRVVFTLDHDFHQLLALSGDSRPSVVFLRFDHLTAASAFRVISQIVKVYSSDLVAGFCYFCKPRPCEAASIAVDEC